MTHHANASAWLTEVKVGKHEGPERHPIEVGRPGPSGDPVG
jgi:hypothetical protein